MKRGNDSDEKRPKKRAHKVSLGELRKSARQMNDVSNTKAERRRLKSLPPSHPDRVCPEQLLLFVQSVETICRNAKVIHGYNPTGSESINLDANQNSIWIKMNGERFGFTHMFRGCDLDEPLHSIMHGIFSCFKTVDTSKVPYANTLACAMRFVHNLLKHLDENIDSLNKMSKRVLPKDKIQKLCQEDLIMLVKTILPNLFGLVYSCFPTKEENEEEFKWLRVLELNF